MRGPIGPEILVSHKREAPPRPVSRQHSKEDPGRKDSSTDNCIMCIQERSEGTVTKFEGKVPGRGLVRQQRCSSKEQRLVSRRSLQDYTSDNSTVQRFEGIEPVRRRFEGIAPVKNVQRSKSDAQDKLDFISDRQSVRTKFSSKIIKRSMSFNRIFSNSMLGRSKEYKL